MKNTMKKPVNIPVSRLRPFEGHPFKVKDDEEKETIKIPSVRLEGKIPSGYTVQQKEDFIVKAVDHYNKYRARQRDRDSR